MNINFLSAFRASEKFAWSFPSAKPCFLYRASQIFGSYGILVSERSYSKDEESFAGIVDFVELKNIPRRVRELTNMTFREFSAYRHERQQNYRYRFDPFKIFSNAGVYDLLAKLHKGATPKGTDSGGSVMGI